MPLSPVKAGISFPLSRSQSRSVRSSEAYTDPSILSAAPSNRLPERTGTTAIADKRGIHARCALLNDSTANWANTPGSRPQNHRRCWRRRHEPPGSFQSRFNCNRHQLPVPLSSLPHPCLKSRAIQALPRCRVAPVLTSSAFCQKHALNIKTPELSAPYYAYSWAEKVTTVIYSCACLTGVLLTIVHAFIFLDHDTPLELEVHTMARCQSPFSGYQVKFETVSPRLS